MPYNKKPLKKSKDKSAPADETLAKVLKDFKSSWGYASGTWHNRWRDNSYLYNGQRVKRSYEGIADICVPMAYSVVETLTSAIFGSKPTYTFLPPQQKQDQKTDILNALLEYYWDKDQWSLKNITTGRNTFKLGTAVDYYYWNIDHPVKIHVPIRDFFIDPTASCLEDARFMGRRYLTTKAELESFEVVDPKTGEMVKKYKNLDQIDAYKQGENTDKQEKDMWYGSTVENAEEEQVEVIEYWTMDKCISIANRCAVIEDNENYFKAKAKANGVKHPKGIMPFNDARDVTDESLFYAKGEIDFIFDLVEELNDLKSQKMDSITYVLNQMYTVDSAHADKASEVENLPGAVYPYEIKPVVRGTVAPESFNEEINLKNDIRETAAANEVVKGAPTEGGKATATEINAQIAGFGQRTGMKVTQFENGYFHREARIVFEMVKLYVTEPMMVRIVGKDGARWEQFDPKEFQDGDYEPHVQLEITVENHKQQQAAQIKELAAAFIGDPDINQLELKKLMLSKGFSLDPDEVELLMTPNPMQMPPEMPGMMAPPELPPPPDPVASLFQPQEPLPPEGVPV